MITKDKVKNLTSEEKDELICRLLESNQQLQSEVESLRLALHRAFELIKILEGRVSKNVKNSSKPPSSDGMRKPKSLRKKAERKTGGQNGHTGTTLNQVETPDVIVNHTAELCETCLTSLVSVEALGFERRQEFDLPKIEPVVTKHLAEIKICPHCSCQTKGKFPEDITQPVQYGLRVKAMASYLERSSYFSRRYSHILREGLKEIPPIHQGEKKRGKPKQHPEWNLLDRLRDFKRETLAFIHDFTVDFTKNRAERDVRMIKVKQKISGYFRSYQGSEMFLRTRGYISTARKNALNPLDALTDVFKGTPFIPSPTP